MTQEKRLQNVLIRIILAALTLLILPGCSSKLSPVDSLLKAEPDTLEYRMMYRYTDPITEQVNPYLSGWLPADAEALPAGELYGDEWQKFINETGRDTILKLQEALHTAALKETDKPMDEKEINYMIRLPDETVYSFYRNGYIKFVNGDERHIYTVESSAYDELMKELDAYIPFWATSEFRADMFPDS